MEEASRNCRWYSTLALLVLLVAAGLRLYRLPELPVGLHYDEAANGALAGAISSGLKTPIFIPSYTGKEVLFFYWAALLMRFIGANALALRLGAALVGLATVAATAWAVRELLHGRQDANWVALVTAAFVATSFWHLIISRYGFRAVTQPLVQTLTIGALWRGLRRHQRPSSGALRAVPWLLLAGLFCGLTAYTYLAARAFPVPLAFAGLALLISDRGHRRARAGQLAISVASAALTLAPLAHYWLTHPGSFLTRALQVAASDWPEAWAGFRACLGMFFIRGDPYIRFNLPQRPLLDPVTAALFLLGIVALIRFPGSQKRRTTSTGDPLLLATRVFLLVHLPFMLLPSALATGEITPSNLRTAGLLPFVYVFPALSLSEVAKRISRRYTTHKGRPSLPVARCSLIVLLLALLSPITATAYFRDWAPSAALYYASDGDLADIAAHLNRTDLATTTPFVASIHYRHPTVAFLAKDYDRVRWLPGGSTLVFPQDKEAILFFPRSSSNDLAWVESVLPEESRVSAPPGPDGEPAFRIYRVDTSSTDSVDYGGVLAPSRPVNVNLGNAALLLGYDIDGKPRSGGNVGVAVWWRVLNRPNVRDYGPIARLTDQWGSAWGETLPFHYPSEQWTPGERIIDHLRIRVAPGAPPGDYVIRFGLYSGSADITLPVLGADGRYAGTNVGLPIRLDRAVAPPPVGDLGIRVRLDAHVAGLALLGANLNTSSARPGEPLYLTLFWRADDAPLPNYDVHLTVGDTLLTARAPVHGTYPTSRWASGEVVSDRYDPRLPRDMPPGNHRLRLQLVSPSAFGLALDLGIVTVQPIDRTFDAPPISHPQTATLGSGVDLLGYDLSTEVIAPGETLILTLYWRARMEMDESYTVFTHLLAPDGSVAGQRDSYPVNGTYPTSLWLAEEIITDIVEVPIRTDAQPGAHQLQVGMYIAENGARLRIEGTDDDAVAIQTIAVATQ